jgi:hypothetical protein
MLSSWYVPVMIPGVSAVAHFFYYAPEWNPYWTASLASMRETIIKHTYPLKSECRAYGRLKELCAEHLAVRVYGHVALYLTAKCYRRYRAS